ncbi:MAG TPA: tetratricopeptide repeat protein [Bryobacteraceae bacterium]|nr:tetratricopeptide repeat protein [Bryobacteraceae bacterium]
MDRLTRKELKSDRFALEVQHSVEYVSEHRRQLIRWGSVAAGILVVAVAFFLYRNHQHAAREQALTEAIKIGNATVGPSDNPMLLTFPTAADRSKAVTKAFSEIVAKYPGTDEGALAQFSLAVNASDDGNAAEAERRFKAVVDSGNAQYSSLAKLSLAQIYASQGKVAEGVKLIDSVIDHPTTLVSKEQAIIEKAVLLIPTDPTQARKLLEPLRSSPRAEISSAAISHLSEMQKPK